MLFSVINFGAVFSFVSASASEAIEVAITIDDLPATGASVDDHSRLQIAQQMIRTLKEAGISGVYGFANGKGVKDSLEFRNILKQWRQAGHFIGNHTFAHSDLGVSSPEVFIKDIEDNEILFKDSVPDKEFKLFRFPFLQEGETKEKRAQIRKYLFKKKYKIAQVSLDFEDWAWNYPYARCLKKKDLKALEKLKETFLQHAVKRLGFATNLSHRLFRRNIKHILLLHVGAVDAAYLKDLIQAYRKAGVKFIPLAAAMKDPVYAVDPQFVGPVGKTFLVQYAEAKQGVVFDKFPTPKNELEGMCLN